MPKHRRRTAWVAAASVATAATLIGIGIAVAHDMSATASGCTYVRSDFNGDGYADVAASEPGRTVSGATQAGAVRVLKGTSSGLTATGNLYFDETSVGLTPKAYDNFGAAVAPGYFNSDCYADLAIGVPGANGDVGRVVILYGSSSGLTTANATVLEASAADTGDTSGDRFGMSLATGKFAGQTTDGLAVGAPGDNNAAGAVALFTSDGTSGVARTGSGWVTQNSPGIPGGSERGDGFGWSLAAADFTGDHKVDLAIGLPFEDLGSVSDAGSVVVMVGPISNGIAASAQGWSEDSTSVVGVGETDDEWGFSLAAGDVNKDGKADLIIGAPGETDGTTKHSGGITVLRGAASGLTGSYSQYFSQNSSGVPDANETNDWFGSALAVGDFNGDGHADVAVGDPSEAIGSLSLAGSVTVINGSSSGLTGSGSTVWTQNTSGIIGGSEARDMFGLSLAALPVTKDAYTDLVIGVGGESTSTFFHNGAIALIKGLPVSSSVTKAGLTSSGNQFFDATKLSNGAQSGPTGIGFGGAVG